MTQTQQCECQACSFNRLSTSERRAERERQQQAANEQSEREAARLESGYELLSEPGKRLWDALWDDKQRLGPEFDDACEECGHVGEHTPDCSTGYCESRLEDLEDLS